MKLQYRLLDYLSITSFVWGMYLLWLVPFQIFWIKLDATQFADWLFYGTILEYMFSYPIAKAIAKYAPKITLYWQEMSDD